MPSRRASLPARRSIAPTATSISPRPCRWPRPRRSISAQSEALIEEPLVRVISFTGSTAAGRLVGELAARHLKRVHLELGGNSALIVLDDADLDRAVSAGAWGSFLHQGQICMTTGRHLVQEVRVSNTVTLPYTPASVGVARRLLMAELLGAGIREPAAHDAALVMSELLSNALRHARPLPDGQVRVGWGIDADMLEVTVSDGGAVTRPRASRPSLSSLGGRGLSIVTHLTWRWGVRTEDGGTTVWALLRATPVNGRRLGNISGVTERQSGDTYGDVTFTRPSEGSGGDREPHPRRGQRGRPARHGPASSSGFGTAADNPAK